MGVKAKVIGKRENPQITKQFPDGTPIERVNFPFLSPPRRLIALKTFSPDEKNGSEKRKTINNRRLYSLYTGVRKLKIF